MKLHKRSKYRVIYADPPWPEYGGGKIKRGADRHYPLMSIATILRLGEALQEHVADDGCHLYLWVTNTHLAKGFLVMDSWGFRYKTTITWFKDRFGLGQYYRGQTEHCLFGVRGRLPYRTTAEGKRAQGIWTRGRDFPLSRLESRMKCPSCGSRKVTIMFDVPPNNQVMRAVE